MKNIRGLLLLSLVVLPLLVRADWPSGVLPQSLRPSAPNSYGALVDLGTLEFNPGPGTAGPYSGLAGKDGWRTVSGGGWEYYGTKSVTAPQLSFSGKFTNLQFWQHVNPPIYNLNEPDLTVPFNAANWFADSYVGAGGGGQGD